MGTERFWQILLQNSKEVLQKPSSRQFRSGRLRAISVFKSFSVLSSVCWGQRVWVRAKEFKHKELNDILGY
jgi:hypothetical protein